MHYLSFYVMTGLALSEWVFIFLFTRKRIRIPKESELPRNRTLSVILAGLIAIAVIMSVIFLYLKKDKLLLAALGAIILVLNNWWVTLFSNNYPDSLQRNKDKERNVEKNSMSKLHHLLLVMMLVTSIIGFLHLILNRLGIAIIPIDISDYALPVICLVYIISFLLGKKHDKTQDDDR